MQPSSPRGVIALLQCRRGATAAIVALLLPILLGASALAIESIEMTYVRRAMQRQADSGALAGAFARSQSQLVTATVTGDLAKNANIALNVAPVIENAPTSGTYAGSPNAVRVVLATDLTLPFSRMFAPNVRIRVSATAAVVSIGDYCAVALEGGNVAGISMGGNATVELSCGMATNSIAANGVTSSGSAVVKATPIAAVGGLQPSSNYVPPTVLIPYSVPQADPFAALPNPVPSGGKLDGSVNSNQTAILSPGRYEGMNLKGIVTLNPGVYYVDGGSFSVGAQAAVKGDGVTIVLTSSTAATNASSIASVDINGGAYLNLTATTTGTYAGILFYQDRRALDSGNNKINGNANSKLQGAIYFPRQEVQFTGTSGMTIDCIQLVARRLVFTGNSLVRNNCPTGSGAQAFKGTRVKLVA